MQLQNSVKRMPDKDNKELKTKGFSLSREAEALREIPGEFWEVLNPLLASRTIENSLLIAYEGFREEGRSVSFAAKNRQYQCLTIAVERIRSFISDKPIVRA